MEINIQQRIYEIRNQKVMFDFHIAELYGIETKKLNQAVRRNLTRFPEDFMFQLTKNEFEGLRSQFVTSNRGGTRYLPFVFTEHGILMLSSVLHNETAIEVNISIMRTFLLLRNHARIYQEVIDRLNIMEGNYNDVFEVLNYLMQKDNQLEIQTNREEIGYK